MVVGIVFVGGQLVPDIAVHLFGEINVNFAAVLARIPVGVPRDAHGALPAGQYRRAVFFLVLRSPRLHKHADAAVCKGNFMVGIRRRKHAGRYRFRIGIRAAVNPDGCGIVVVVVVLLHRQFRACRNLQRSHFLRCDLVRQHKAEGRNPFNGFKPILVVFVQTCPFKIQGGRIVISRFGIGVGIVRQRLRHVNIQDRQDAEGSLIEEDSIIGLRVQTIRRHRVVALILARVTLECECEQGRLAAFVRPGDDFIVADAGDDGKCLRFVSLSAPICPGDGLSVLTGLSSNERGFFLHVVAVSPALNVCGKKRIIRNINCLDLMLRLHIQFSPQYMQQPACDRISSLFPRFRFGQGIVALRVCIGRKCDCVFADIFPVRTGRSKAEQFNCLLIFLDGIRIGANARLFIQDGAELPFVFAYLQAVDRHVPFGVVIAVGLFGILHLQYQFRRIDCEDSRGISHIIVALYVFACRCDRIFTDVLSRRAVQIKDNNRGLVVVYKAGNLRGKLRVIFPVQLFRCYRRYSCIGAFDCENVRVSFLIFTDEIDLIVPLIRLTFQRDGILARILATLTTDFVRNGIVAFQPLNGDIGRVIFAVGLLGAGGDCDFSLVDRQNTCLIQDTVARLYGIAGRRNDIGTDIVIGAVIFPDHTGSGKLDRILRAVGCRNQCAVLSFLIRAGHGNGRAFLHHAARLKCEGRVGITVGFFKIVCLDRNRHGSLPVFDRQCPRLRFCSRHNKIAVLLVVRNLLQSIIIVWFFLALHLLQGIHRYAPIAFF